MPELTSVFDRLKRIMKPLEHHLQASHDTNTNYTLQTLQTRADGYRYWFGSVQIKKNYVSYHLPAVYAYPELLHGLSPALRKRMQGKSCFNFKQIDETLMDELEALTQQGLAMYQQRGF